jgi:hypothetical protein
MSAKDKNTEHSDSFADLDFFISRQVFESYSFQVSLMFNACFVCILICLYHLPWVAPHCGTSYQVLPPSHILVVNNNLYYGTE